MFDDWKIFFIRFSFVSFFRFSLFYSFCVYPIILTWCHYYWLETSLNQKKFFPEKKRENNDRIPFVTHMISFFWKKKKIHCVFLSDEVEEGRRENLFYLMDFSFLQMNKDYNNLKLPYSVLNLVCFFCLILDFGFLDFWLCFG